jgi:hypothetical protein
MTTTLTLPVTPDLSPVLVDLARAVSVSAEITATEGYIIVPRAALTPAARRLASALERITGTPHSLEIVHTALWDWLVNELDTTLATSDTLAATPDNSPDFMAYLAAAKRLATGVQTP